jgi:hypothetical protein
MRIIRKYECADIYNKEHSREIIQLLGMNTVDSILVTRVDAQVRKFLRRHGLVGIRFMEFGRQSQYGLKPGEAEEFLSANLPRFKIFRVEQSLKKYDSFFMEIQGEFILSRFNCSIEGTFNCEPGHSLKEINRIGLPIGPIVERSAAIHKVKSILMLHGLYDVVAEMTLYRVPVGMYRDNYICWELRTRY